jgi:hypothetical protein
MIDLDEIERRASRRSDSFADREEFNLHARTDVPALVAEVRRLREAIHGMVGQCRFNCTPATYCGMCGIGYEVLNEPGRD